MSLVRRRVLRLGERDLAQQLWFIRAALATLSSDAGRVPDRAPPPAGPDACADRGRLLAAARAVGDRIEALALRDEHGASWIGLDPGPRGHWALTPMGADLYGGLAGQALFLAYLGAVTEETRYTRLAREASTALRRRVERDRSSARSIGGFNGWGGIIYALAHLGALWGEPAPLAEAEAIVGLLPDLIESDERFDIIGGSAGCIGGLLVLQRIAPSDRTLAAAIRCGDRLLACARPMPRGIGWLPKGLGTRPLAGFAHGAAGIAWALLELAARSGEGRFRAAAGAAIAYERTLFSAGAGNWLDVREREGARPAGEGPAPCMTAWCHGAPGSAWPACGRSRTSTTRQSGVRSARRWRRPSPRDSAGTTRCATATWAIWISWCRRPRRSATRGGAARRTAGPPGSSRRSTGRGGSAGSRWRWSRPA